MGGILAASMTPPLPRTTDVEGPSRTENLDLEQGGGRNMVATAPPLPTYDEIMAF